MHAKVPLAERKLILQNTRRDIGRDTFSQFQNPTNTKQEQQVPCYFSGEISENPLRGLKHASEAAFERIENQGQVGGESGHTEFQFLESARTTHDDGQTFPFTRRRRRESRVRKTVVC